MRCLVTLMALLPLPGLAAAQASGSLQAQVRVIDASPSQVALSAARSRARTLSTVRAVPVGIAILAERPPVAAAGEARPASRIIEISFLRN
ncbi:MAG TPA: hypothetical protein VF862_05775 [Gemmatimonadales bacterium]